MIYRRDVIRENVDITTFNDDEQKFIPGIARLGPMIEVPEENCDCGKCVAYFIRQRINEIRADDQKR
jgi:hypothetical protein